MQKTVTQFILQEDTRQDLCFRKISQGKFNKLELVVDRLGQHRKPKREHCDCFVQLFLFRS